VIVNPAEVYGPHDEKLVTAGNLVDFAHSDPVVVPTGGTSVVHIDDVAIGIVRAFEHGRVGERYILGGDNLSFKALATLTMEILDAMKILDCEEGESQRVHQGRNVASHAEQSQKRPKRILLLPNMLLLMLAKVGSALRIPLPFEPAVIPYAVRFWWMDNSKAQTELGVSFRSARETLTPTLQWLIDAEHIRQ